MLRRFYTYNALLRARPLFVNVALATFFLCLSLIIAELILRSIIPLDSGRPFEFRIPHPVLGWVLKPGANYRFKMPESTVSVAYNSEGWRDVEHRVEKPDGVFRILVLGDSFMEANTVELSDAFHRRVEAFARTAGSNVEVINMGVAGYGTLQEYLVFRDIGKLYEPDLVLLGFYGGNDLMNNSMELAAMINAGQGIPDTRPYLDMDEPTRWVITPVNFEVAQRKYAESIAELDAKRNSFSEKLLFLKLAREGLARIPIPEFLKVQASNQESIDRERQELAVLGVNYCKEPAEYTRAWNTTERILAKLKEDVEARGSELVVFSIPAFEEVSNDYMEVFIANASFPDKLCLEEAPGHKRLSLILTKLEIVEVQLISDFRRVIREDGIQLYQFSEGMHWNPAGNALAARRVVSELVSKQKLPTHEEQVAPLP